MQYKIIKLTLFPYDIMYCVGMSVKQVEIKLKKFGVELNEEDIERLNSSGLAHTLQIPNRAVLIYIPGEPTHGLIAHEVFHAVWMVLATMGVEPSVESEEVYAYMIEYIINEIGLQ